MGSFANRSYSSSPLMTLQPQHTPQSAFSMHAARPSFVHSPFVKQSPSSTWSVPMSSAPVAPAPAKSRKRSRDEASENLEDEYQFPVAAPVQENEDGWEYGEGMTLIKPSKSGYLMSADSQTGTWMEEKAYQQAQELARASSSPERPILRSAKSQRLHAASSPSGGADEVSLNHPTSATTPYGPSASGEPTIDDFTRHLGIGWSMISNDDHIQAAVRGWTKYIENHFPVTHAVIRLQSRGLASYLVEAREGYFLFGEDLKQGRLVSTRLERTFANLQGSVPVFDGEELLEAGATPKPDTTIMNGMKNDTMEMVTNANCHAMTNQTVEVDMEMS